MAAVVVLLVNDQLLKRVVPGWWTGKLSDVAGVVVIGVVASVVIGRRAGLVVAALGFAVLKTVPGAAELAAPMLGGVTLRDHSDLLALAVVVPLWWRLGRPIPGPQPLRRPSGTWSHVRWGALGSATLPVLSACVAMVVATATSCGPSPAVVQVFAADGSVYALLARGYGEASWARSDDDGRTWVEAERPVGVEVDDAAVADPYGDAVPLGPLESCVGEVCYRVEAQRRIDRAVGDGAPTAEFVLSDDQYLDISTGCLNQQRGVLTSVVAVPSGREVIAVASLGAEGVVVGSPSGDWTRVDVLDARPPNPPANTVLLIGAMVFGPVVALGTVLVMRRRWPSWAAAIATALAGWVASLLIAGGAAFLEFRHVDAVLAVLLSVTLLVTVLVGRSRAFAGRDGSVAVGSAPYRPAPPPGWFPDPSNRHELRWWDGTEWTDDISTGSVPGTDPLEAE